MMTMHVPGIGRIFISYRRTDATYPAGWLFDRLTARYGPDRVFKDVDSIHPGDDFAATIGSALDSCTILLAVIGPRWLTTKNRAGRRLDDPDDFVRLELEAALARQIRVIPILVDGAKMPEAADLPPGLTELARRQAMTLSPDRFASDTDRLLKALDAMLAVAATRDPPLVTPLPGHQARTEDLQPSHTDSEPSSRPSPGSPEPPESPPAHDTWPASREAATLKVRHRKMTRTAALIITSAIIFTAAALAAWNFIRGPATRTAGLSRPTTLASDPYVPQSVAFSPDGTILAVAANFKNHNSPGRTYLFNPSDGAVTAVLRSTGSSSGVNTVGFSPNGRTLATGDGNATTYLWNLTSRTITRSLADPDGEGVESVAFSPTGRLLAAGDYNGRTYLWNLITRKLVAALRDPGRHPQVDSVAFSPSGSTLATGDNDGSAYLWNLTTRTITATFTDPGHQHDVGAVAFSPDGSTLATGDSDGSAYLWNLNTGTLIAALPDPGREGIDAIAIDPGGTTLAAGDNDGSTYLWDLATRTITATLTDPGREGVNAIAFSPGGATLATGDNDARTYLWTLTDNY